MPRVALPFVGPAYEARTSRLDAQRCVNLYPELDESPKGKTVAALLGTPGLTSRQTFPGQGGIRGMHRASNGGRPFVVQGDRLYELTSLTTKVERGTLTGHSTPVSMDDNGLQVCIVADRRGWIFTLATDELEEITDKDFLGATTVAFLDGYFVFNRPDTNQAFHSELLDGLSYRGDDFFSAEGSPDRIVGVYRDHRELWLVGESTIEVRVSSQGTPAFVVLQNAYMEQGIVAPFTFATLDNSVYWLGLNLEGQGVVWRASAYTPQRISTHAIETALNRTELTSARAFSYQEEGHWFYVLSTLSHTWVYDAATGLWHERAALDAEGQCIAHPAATHMFAFNRHLVGDKDVGIVYEQSLDVYTNAGAPLPRIRVAPYVSADRVRLFHQRLEIDLAVGVGLSDGDVYEIDPQLLLAISEDHAHTWSSERRIALGRQGEFLNRVYATRLGSAYDRLYRVTITDPVSVAIVGAYLELK